MNVVGHPLFLSTCGEPRRSMDGKVKVGGGGGGGAGGVPTIIRNRVSELFQ